MKKTLLAALVGIGVWSTSCDEVITYIRSRDGGIPGAGGSASGGTSTGGATDGNSTGGTTSGWSSTGGAQSGGSSSGGSGSGGANTGGASSGGQSSGGSSTGGASTGDNGSGGQAGQVASTVIWRDSIQAGAGQFGFDGIGVELPIGTSIAFTGIAGANLTRAFDPAGGTGYALRHVCSFDQGGCRSQVGVYGFQNTVFGNQAKRPEGIWVAMEWYFPIAVTTGADGIQWINMWDWHSTDGIDGGHRWHTSPGLMLRQDGSMAVRWEWGGEANTINPTSPWSAATLPVGRWFDIEMHYMWAASGVTLELWIDGQPALKQSNVVTKRSTHTVVEMYSKWYGAQNDGPRPWSPLPAVRYTRNVRVGNGRIWPQK